MLLIANINNKKQFAFLTQDHNTGFILTSENGTFYFKGSFYDRNDVIVQTLGHSTYKPDEFFCLSPKRQQSIALQVEKSKEEELTRMFIDTDGKLDIIYKTNV